MDSAIIRQIYMNLKRLLNRRVVVSFITISNSIIIIFIKYQLSLISQINKEIESTSHDKRTLINDGYIYF
jgi:anti-anti-sigma regulatory factor